LFFFEYCFRSVPEIKQKQKMEEKIVNEKYQEPTLEKLRALLSGHPELLNQPTQKTRKKER